MATDEDQRRASSATAKLPGKAASFIGYGTQQIICNSGWSTERTPVTVLDAGKAIIRLSSPIGVMRSLPSNPSSIFPVHSNANLGATAGSAKPDAALTYPGKLVGGKNTIIIQAKSVNVGCDGRFDRTAAEGKACSSDVHPETVQETSVGGREGVTIVTRDDESASVSTSSKTVVEGAQSLDRSDLVEKSVEEDKENSNECDVDGMKDDEEMEVSENNNDKDVVVPETIKTEKAAARLQLNAVLQNEIENQRMNKLLKAAKLVELAKPVECKAPVGVTKTVNLAGVQRKSFGTSLLGTAKPTLSQSVRIQNSKIVEVRDRDEKVTKPGTRFPNQVYTGNGYVPGSRDFLSSNLIISKGTRSAILAIDIYGQSTSPNMFFPSLQDDSNVAEEIVSATVNRFVQTRESEMPSVGEDNQMFAYDPLCIGADTLMPVAGTPGHSDRQGLDEIDMMCMRMNKQDASDGTAKTGSDETAPSDDFNQTVFRCFLCSYHHTKQAKIAKHWINTHLSQKPYVCGYCDKSFTTSFEAQVHIGSLHPSEKLTIGIKNSMYFAASLAYEVVRSETAEDRQDTAEAEAVILARKDILLCKKCDFQCDSGTELQAHQKSVHSRFKPHFCAYCPNEKQAFLCDFDLKWHIRNDHPERVPATGRMFPDLGLPVVAADIDWLSTYEAITMSNQVLYQCRLCTFRALSSNGLWKHVLGSHNWPESVKCPSCATMFELKPADRESFIALCTNCRVRVALGPDAALTKQPEKSAPLYTCLPCDYKTPGKGSMNRHLKYNHTKCRPYGCPYCNYVAVERPKVKSHIESSHKGKDVHIKERKDSRGHFREMVEDLFKKIVSVSYFSEIQAISSSVANEDTAEDNDSNNSKPQLKRSRLMVPDNNGNVLPQTSMSSATDMIILPQSRQRERKSINGEHFKCTKCGYVCIDRSCMSRHVKYMHILSRPHACPYCRYTNVEKTKVRLHVKSHHPNQPRCVKTNKKLLEDMSSEAKKYYVRIDCKGRVMKENNNACTVPRYSPSLEYGQNTNSQESSTIGDEFVLTELDPETDIIDVQTSEGGAATVVLKNGTYEVGIKEEPDEDIGVKAEPRIESVSVVEMSASSVSALDHDYVISLPASVPMDLPVTVKTEPEDNGYELSMEKLSPTESMDFSNKSFIGGSSVAPTDDEDDDGDIDVDDEDDEDESMIDVPLGASASNLAGIDGLDSDDDLEDDLDSDMLDLGDLEFDNSRSFLSDLAEKRWKPMDDQVERDRLHLLSQIKMDDVVRDDPKIWMRTVVRVEDIISRISANKPIMDL